MNTVVDFHSHILPGIDDGSASVEESIAMLQMEADQGIEHVIATPHFYASCDNLERFLENRARSEQLLREEMAKYNGLPKLSIGAEVYFFAGISETSQIASLAVANTKHILVEMPPPPWSDDMYRELERLYTKQGLVPIIAHLDRYITRLRTFGIPEKLAALPVVVQANAAFFLNKRTSSFAMRLLQSEKIHLLGSDCHSLGLRRPNLGEAARLIEKKLGPTAIAKIKKNEQTVLR